VPGWNDPEIGDTVIDFSKLHGYHSEDEITDQIATRGFDPEQITGLFRGQPSVRFANGSPHDLGAVSNKV
jgi:hypothetical protein